MTDGILPLVSYFTIPLLLTILIESGIAFLSGIREPPFYFAATLVNILTNPLLNFICLLLYENEIYYTNSIIIVCELFIIITEWKLLVYVFPNRQLEMLKLSAVMNIGSYGFGLLLLG